LNKAIVTFLFLQDKNAYIAQLWSEAELVTVNLAHTQSFWLLGILELPPCTWPF